jgi:hypothetical protein
MLSLSSASGLMRIQALVIPALIVLSVVGSFFAGRFVGSYDAEKKLSTLPAELSGQQSVATLFVLNNAIQRLQESRAEEAERILEQYAQVQIPGVIACSKSAMCTAFSGTLMPNAAELKKLESPGERVPSRR